MSWLVVEDWVWWSVLPSPVMSPNMFCDNGTVKCMKLFQIMHNWDLAVVGQQTLVSFFGWAGVRHWTAQVGKYQHIHQFQVPDMLQLKGGGAPKYLQNLAAFDRALVWCSLGLLQSTYLFLLPTTFWIWPSFCNFLLGSIQSCDKSPAQWSCF